MYVLGICTRYPLGVLMTEPGDRLPRGLGLPSRVPNYFSQANYVHLLIKTRVFLLPDSL